ncbi:hypothetical protein AB0283_03220 [Micromonospora vinacea]|uniref:hypothetical protein n=1 Tax=Micromonospora vinacea TaxID=709878 RepID=UPI00344E9E61
MLAGGVSAYQIAGRSRATLGGDRRAGAVRGLAVGSGLAAAAARVDKGQFWRTRSVQSGGLPAGGSGYLAAWPGPC